VAPASNLIHISLEYFCRGRSLQLRKWISAKRAAVRQMLGRGGGFFVQYEYVDSILPVAAPYPEVERLCAESPFREFIADMAANIPAYQALGSSPGDPRWHERMFPALDCAALFTAVTKFQPRRSSKSDRATRPGS
jgi:hypothetical protein